MTHDEVTRDEFERLKARVRALEYQLEYGDGDEPADPADGFDHRDRVVLEHMRQNGRLAGFSLVKCYINKTDIVNHSTARRRAKMLEQHPRYQEIHSDD